MTSACHLAALFVVLSCVFVSAEVRLQSVDRKINLNSQFARVSEAIKAKNTGSAPIDHVVLCTLDTAGLLAYRKVTEVGSKTELQVLSASVADAPAGVSCVKALVNIPAGDTVSLQTTVVLAKAQAAHPAELAQGEPQLMVYTDNLYVVSPYIVSQQSTEVTLPNSKILTVSEGGKKKDSKVTFGKYELIQPFSLNEMRLHYDQPSSFKTAVTCVREIEVSHWGNIYVEESYELKNSGAQHKGPFSRLKYMHSYQGKGNSFRELVAHLPPSAHHLYYTDIIGNISTSDVRKSFSETRLDIAARYPLLGGWKVDFTIGYSIPLAGFLFTKKSDGKRRLSMDLSTPFEDVFVEDLVVKVVLPEGSSDIKATLPYDMEQSFDTKFTYLDTTGRAVLVLHKKNLVPEHAAKFDVDYSFPPTSMLREPGLLIAVFLALFVTCIIYNRLEFTISRDDKWQEAQMKEKLSTVMEQVSSILEDESDLTAKIIKLINSLRDSADADHTMAEKQKIDKSLQDLDNKLSSLREAVRITNSRVATDVDAVCSKASVVRQKCNQLYKERVELAKKGIAAAEARKKVAGELAKVEESHRELVNQVDEVFGTY